MVDRAPVFSTGVYKESRDGSTGLLVVALCLRKTNNIESCYTTCACAHSILFIHLTQVISTALSSYMESNYWLEPRQETKNTGLGAVIVADYDQTLVEATQIHTVFFTQRMMRAVSSTDRFEPFR